jgi:hypothetical protein
VDKVALGQVFLQALWLSPVCIIPQSHLFIYLFHLPSDLYRYGSSHRIQKSTRECAEHLSQHNLQKKERKKEKENLDIN